MGKTKHMSIDIRWDVFEKLRQYSLDNKIYMTDVVSEAVTKYLEKV